MLMQYSMNTSKLVQIPLIYSSTSYIAKLRSVVHRQLSIVALTATQVRFRSSMHMTRCSGITALVRRLIALFELSQSGCHGRSDLDLCHIFNANLAFE
ncbi:predicted protein [Sclerotinia sclerotiorum 1980 UF-70]|uniref:Uncharacterized protein n=1 Tax=Sclerotinia sclerotiorum (strain ATCC 18683 / 1980 / Ss-1) TaxID=665079 RepID=A7EKV7_SCLS1|nr:predicted protein [Sclerotinia sclerotiorum 1980 UF-70]EDO03473.1 predicted protein [Sclerotinia sclerotiorum 1980 UF-70]